MSRELLGSLTVRGVVAIAVGLVGMAIVGALRRFLGDDALTSDAAAAIRYALQGLVAGGAAAFGIGLRRAIGRRPERPSGRG